MVIPGGYFFLCFAHHSRASFWASAIWAEAAGPQQTAPASVVGVVLDLLRELEAGSAGTQENDCSHAMKNSPKSPR